jgi:hypothetical protein
MPSLGPLADHGACANNHQSPGSSSLIIARTRNGEAVCAHAATVELNSSICYFGPPKNRLPLGLQLLLIGSAIHTTCGRMVPCKIAVQIKNWYRRQKVYAQREREGELDNAHSTEYSITMATIGLDIAYLSFLSGPSVHNYNHVDSSCRFNADVRSLPDS